MTTNDFDKKEFGRGADFNASALSGRLLARNTVFNLIGQAIPMLVALIAIPFIIKGLGVGRFGVLTLAWMVVGYFSLFDLGLGRATTKFVAEYLGKGENLELTKLAWASIFMLFGVGLAGMTVAIILMPWIVNDLLNIPPELRTESLKAFYLLACSIPIVTGTAGFRGILEAMQRFDLINFVKVPTYIAAFAGPLAVLPFSTNLFPIVLVLLASRLAALMAYAMLCAHSLTGLMRFKPPALNAVRKLMSYGGWLTVSNIIWPVMTYTDRFIIGAMLTMSAVAYYATPYELAAKMMIITGSLIGVVFPAFSVFAAGQHEKLMSLHNKAVKYLLLALVPIVFAIIALAEPFFRIWLGPEFARNSALVLQILAAAKLINSISQVPSSAIQAMGRPDITAKLHMIELPVYLVMVWLLIKSFGITGAAIAWLTRTILDTGLYFWFFHRLSSPQPQIRKRPQAKLIIWGAVMLLTAILLTAIPGMALRAGLTIAVLGAMVLYCRSHFLDTDEKRYLSDIWNKFIGRGNDSTGSSARMTIEKKHEYADFK